MIVAARANGLDAIDGPFADFRDESGYRTEAAWASALGGVGKWAIHPSQVPIANDVFSPTEQEIARHCS
jgi:citrate lyase subunit beta/citryl-CoA lyase